jgi:hypothetical protein
MAQLYQDIMSVPGLNGNTAERQAQYYQNLGSPMGAYKGSYEQNMYLWNQIQKGNYSKSPVAKPAAKPSSIIPVPTARTPFSQVLPYEQVFNPQLMTSFAESQINPEIQRQGLDATRNLNRGLAASGRYRTGIGQTAQQDLTNEIERTRKEQVQSFMDTVGGYTNDWYNRLYENYYKNPSGFVMPQVPTYDAFTKQNPGLASAYQQQTNVPTTYTNPFKF